MSILNFLLKSKKEMNNKNTKKIRVGKYTLTSHAQNRIVDSTRNLKKFDLLQNLFGHSENSNVYAHNDGTLQYDRINRKNRTITHITAKQHYVKTIRKYHKDKEKNELKIIKGRK